MFLLIHLRKFAVVSLIVFGFSDRMASSQDTKPVDIRAVESTLNSTLKDIANRRSATRSTAMFEQTLDDAFAKWSPRIAPAAQQTAGWPNDQAERLREQRAVEIQVIHTRLLEFCRLLNTDYQNDPLPPEQTRSYCQLLSKSISGEVIGLPPAEKKRVDAVFDTADTPHGFVRATALAHLSVAKHQVGNRQVVRNNIEKLIAEITKDDKTQSDSLSVRKKLSEAVRKQMANEFFTRSMTIKDEIRLRQMFKKVAQEVPHLRSYLIAQQVHHILGVRTKLAEKNQVNSVVVKQLQTRLELARDLKQEYFNRMIATDKNHTQVIKAMDVSQAELRHLQESLDSKNFSVKTYTQEIKLIAAAHLNKASQLLESADEKELSKKINQLHANLISQ